MPNTQPILDLIDNAMHGLSFEDAREFLDELIAELEGRNNALEEDDGEEADPNKLISD
jgi:malate synthase